MIIFGLAKAYKKHKAKKEGEGTEQDEEEKQMLECPNCHEKKKIDFVRTPEQGKKATCMKCGTQWRLD